MTKTQQFQQYTSTGGQLSFDEWEMSGLYNWRIDSSLTYWEVFQFENYGNCLPVNDTHHMVDDEAFPESISSRWFEMESQKLLTA